MGHYRKNLITFVLSENCQLACRYCYMNEFRKIKKEYRALSINFAKKGIDDFFFNNPPAIRFFGVGEATMEFNRMKEIWEYAYKKSGGQLYSELQTNGFFDKKICRWIIDHIDVIWISCDGPNHIQNYLRPTVSNGPSARVVENNIIQLVKANKNIGIRSTIGSTNINYQKEMIDYFDEIGVKAIFASHMCIPVLKTKSKNTDEKDMLVEVDPLDFAKSFLAAKKYAEKKKIFYSNFLLVNFDEPVEISCRAMLPAPQLNPSGYVSSCDMATDITETPMDDLIYGYFDNNINQIIYDHNKIKKIRSRTVNNIPDCQDCFIKHFCAGGCIGEAINETSDFFGIKKNLCEATKFLATSLGTNYNEPYPFIHP